MKTYSLNELLLDAQRNGYAIGAFNVENMEMAKAVITVAQEESAPVIIQTTPSTLRYADVSVYSANIKAFADEVNVPVIIHLDHGNSFELCAKAFRVGYTSIMIDGSKLLLDDNISITRKVVELCSSAGIPVEGELGFVGGKEDDIVSEKCGYTDPDEAVKFVRETGVSSLAVGIGTAHGVYKTVPVLNSELVSTLRKCVDVPMVMHGASGLSSDAIKDCISRGICKVNFATELRIAYTNGIREYLNDNPEAFDPKSYGSVGIERVKEVVRERIRICGCNQRA